MRTLPLSVVAGCLLLTLFAAPAAFAQAPAGPEFRVSSEPQVRSGSPSVSADASGSFVVAWARNIPPDSDVHVRPFGAQGQPLGPDVEVRSFAGGPPRSTGIAREAGGAFIVVWDEPDGVARDIFARRYTAGGAPLGAAFRLNSYTTGLQAAPAVAKAPDGSFVVAWTNEYGGPPALRRVVTRRFAADGTSLGGEFAVDPAGTMDQTSAKVATDGAGNFVVAWDAYDRLDARRFSASGSPVGAPFQVNTSTPTLVDYPSVAVQPDGRFLVAWYGILDTPKIMGRRYQADGTPAGADFVVRRLNGNEGLSPMTAAAAALPGGGFIVAWTGADAEDSGVRAKRFDAAGAAEGPSFVLNSTEADFQSAPALATDPAGNVVSVWLSRVPLGVFDVFGQRFGLLDTVELSVDPSASATSDGNGVLEPNETVDLQPTWRNNTPAPLAMPGTLSSFTGPAGPTYLVDDGVGSYGTVAPGAAQRCADCYRVGVAASARPATHWDGVATELIGDGTGGTKRWVVHVGASFADVPRTSPFYPFVETLLHRAVTGGCAAGSYCPGAPTTREQMSVLVLTAREERPFAPAPFLCAFPTFADVPASSPYCIWIEELARRGVVGGCAPGLYCPTASVSREQMAVFVLRTLDPALNPPACTTPMFADMPASSPFCRWIEELARRGVVTGCGSGNYCPTAAVTREQMSVFLGATFGLTLYGP